MTSINDYSKILNPYINNIKSYINKYHSIDSNLEIEAIFNEPGFNEYNISLNTFNKLYSGLNLSDITPIKTTDYVNKLTRKTVNSDNSEIWINKENFITEYIKDFPVRIKVSKETFINPISEFDYNSIRHKTRYTIPIKNYLKLDLTIVEMQTIGEKRIDSWDSQTTYEVELELLDFSDVGLNYFVNWVDGILLKIYDSNLTYTLSERNIILQFFNKLFSNKYKSDTLDFSILVQARNLKLRDLVYGGLIGNSNTMYGITPKADGLRKLLIFHNSGIWLIHPPNEFNLLIRNVNSFKTLYETVLEGELIPLQKRKNGAPNCKYLFLGFDCLSTRLNNKANIINPSDVMNADKSTRLNIVSTISRLFLQNNLLQIYPKERIVFNTVSDFYNSVRRLFNSQFIYETDGFIFEPEVGPYNPHSEKIPLHKRVLTVYPDICKWKPLKDLSIDFLVQFVLYNGITTPKLYSKKPYDFNVSKNLGFKKGEYLKEFTGSKYNKFSYQMLNLESFKNIPNNSIVEIALIEDKLSVIRIRKDKTKPNNMDIALDVWDDIFRPIEFDTLIGSSFQLVKYYHNNIKRNLFHTVFENPTYDTLLDIGGGRGASVNQYLKFKKVLVIEPDSDNLNELNQRLSNLNLHSKVRVLQCGGENTDIISENCSEFLGGPASVITMNLSLSFFWSGFDKLQALVETIGNNLRDDGLFLFVTIDGESVEQMCLNTDYIDFNGLANIRFFNSTDKWQKYIIIDIPNSIVNNQKEWLVKIIDLQNLFKNYNIQLTMYKKAIDELFLSPNETKFTSLYSYGIFKKNNISVNKNKNIPEMNKVNFNTNALVRRTENEYKNTDNYLIQASENDLSLETVAKPIDLDLQRFKSVKSPRANLNNRPVFTNKIPIVNPLKSVVISEIGYNNTNNIEYNPITELLTRINSPIKSNFKSPINSNIVKPLIPVDRNPGFNIPTISKPIIQINSILEVPVSQISVNNIPPIPTTVESNILPAPLDLESYISDNIINSNSIQIPYKNYNEVKIYNNPIINLTKFEKLYILNSEYILVSSGYNNSFIRSILNAVSVDYYKNPEPVYRDSLVQYIQKELNSNIQNSKILNDFKLNTNKLIDIINNDLNDYNYIVYFCENFNVNILILNTQIQPLYYSNFIEYDKCVILSQISEFDYVSFGIIQKNGIQLLFNSNSDFIKKLL